MTEAEAMEAFEPRVPPLTTEPEGVIRVAGTRVSLETVVYAFDAGSSPEGIVLDEAIQALERDPTQPVRARVDADLVKMPWPGDPRVNLQNDSGKKPYQVRQLLEAIDTVRREGR